MARDAQPTSLPIGPGIDDQATHEEIAAKAYEIFEARGGGHGSDLDDWLEAEHEVLRSRPNDKR